MTTTARLLIAAAALAASTIASAQMGSPQECEQKREGVTAEVEKAKAAGHDEKVRGLERALAEINVSCNEPDLKAKRERRISQQEKEVTQRRLDLREAERSGKADKIAKRKEKLKEAQDELAALKKK